MVPEENTVTTCSGHLCTGAHETHSAQQHQPLQAPSARWTHARGAPAVPVPFGHRETPANQRDRSLCSHGGGVRSAGEGAESETEPRKGQGCRWAQGRRRVGRAGVREARLQEMAQGGRGPGQGGSECLGFKGDPRLRARVGGDLGHWRGPQTSVSTTSGLNRWLAWVGGQGTPQPPAGSVYRWGDMGSKTDIGHQPLVS